MDVGGEDDLDEGVGRGTSGDCRGKCGVVDGLDAVDRKKRSWGENGRPGKGWNKEQAAETGEDLDHAIKVTFMGMGNGYVLVNSS